MKNFAANNLLFFTSQHLGAFPGQETLIAVVLPLAWYTAMLAGLARLPRRGETGLERATFWLDGATVLVSGILILIFVFAHTPGRSSTESPIMALTTIGFPALHGAVIFAAIVVILRPAHGVSRDAVALLAIGVGLGVVAELGYSRAAAVDAHRPGIWYEPVYLLAACFAAAAAQMQRERPGLANARQFEVGSTGSSVVPYVAVAGAVLVVILELGDRWNSTFGTMVIGAVFLTTLVMGRQLISRKHLKYLAAAEQARLTRQAALELQLQQSQKLEAVGLLAGGIAHDFNNILTAIRVNAELVGLTKPGTREDMQEIVRAVDHGASLTRQLLAFGRRDAVQVQRFDLRELVSAMDPMLRRVVTGQIVLRVSLSERSVPVEMDRGQAEQVLLNLAINARDAMPNGGTLAITVDTKHVEASADGEPASDYARLVVSDTGTGMTREVISRMFEPFYTTKPRGRGSGLGLSTVYAIVKRAGGTIDVGSDVGTGSTFELLLPLADATESDETARVSGASALPAEALRGREVILVVDDEAGVRDLVARYLSRSGYAVLSAADGAEALQHLSEHPAGDGKRVDLLLTDLTMPGMSGQTLIERALALDPSLRVICMSGYAETDGARIESAMTYANYIAKPFALSTLGRLVRSTLDAPAR
jgi:signal transduction histidine kinase/ActR/RegA family two-component response regulator